MDLLASGPERAPRRLPRVPLRTRAVLAAALAVGAAGVVSVPDVRAQERAQEAPPVVTATTSGGSVIGGRLRVWLLLEGPGSARVTSVVPRLPGSEVRTGSVPEAFSPQGYAVVRLDVTPSCPDALPGLARAALDVRVDDGRERGARTVQVPVQTDGLLAETVQARCAGQDEVLPGRGPRVRAGDSGGPGALRTVVDLGAPGPEVLVVEGVTPGPGLAVEVVTPLPLRVAVGRRAQLVVDLRPGGCVAAPDTPPFVLEYAADGEVEPVVDDGLRGRLLALRRSGCPAGPG